MKRVITFTLMLALCVSLTGCGGTVEGGLAMFTENVKAPVVPDPTDEEVRQAVDLEPIRK